MNYQTECELMTGSNNLRVQAKIVTADLQDKPPRLAETTAIANRWSFEQEIPNLE